MNDMNNMNNMICSIYPSGGIYQWDQPYPPQKVYLITSGRDLPIRLMYDQCEYWIEPYYNNNEWYLTYQLIYEYRIEPHYTTLFGAKSE
jgi:hypothetical protein